MSTPPTTIVFPGQGTQRPGVGRDNSPEQVVLSGLAGDVRTAERRLANDGGPPLRLVALDVSTPFHDARSAGRVLGRRSAA